ncbi:SseB family protein [Nocardioides nanhaiensis]
MSEQPGPPDQSPADRERLLQGSPYTDDDGSPDVGLARALAALAADPDALELKAAALGALATARLLVPVVAVLGEVEVGPDGLARDKSSDMATVLLTGADGRTALLAFSGTATLQQWRADARPVPVAAQLAAQTALQEGAAAIVLDVAGPTRLVLEGADLQAVAAGARLVRVGEELAWIGSAGESPDSMQR